MTETPNHIARARRRARSGSLPAAGLRAAIVLAIVLAMGAGIAACSSTPTTVPTLPTSVPSLPAGTGCLDATTMGIIAQLQTQGADVPAILAANKDALISGLQAFEPTDPTTVTWRDQLVAALQASDFTTAAARVSELTTSGIALAQC